MTTACDTAVAPADKGITYEFANRCDEGIVVEMASGSDPVALNSGEVGTFRSLDEFPDEAFIVRRKDGTGEMRLEPGMERFDIVGAGCPTP